MGVQIVFEIYPKVGLLNNKVIPFFFFRNLHTILHRGYTNLYSHQHCTKVPLSPHPHQNLSFLFLMIVLLSVKWYLFVFLWWLVKFSTFLYTYWPFACLLLRNVYSGHLLTFNQSGFFFFFLALELHEFCEFWILTPYLLYGLQIFSLIHSTGCVFQSVVSFVMQKHFSLMQSHLSIFVFVAYIYRIISKKLLPSAMLRSFLLVFFQ